MAIVKYTHKDGSQYAYSSLARWDPIRKQNRPIRKYLGKVNPTTGEIIPSSGKRGRPIGSKTNVSRGPKDEVRSGEVLQDEPPVTNTHSAMSQDTETVALKEHNASLQAENEALRNRVLYLERIIALIKDQATSAGV